MIKCFDNAMHAWDIISIESELRPVFIVNANNFYGHSYRSHFCYISHRGEQSGWSLFNLITTPRTSTTASIDRNWNNSSRASTLLINSEIMSWLSCDFHIISMRLLCANYFGAILLYFHCSMKNSHLLY